MAAELAQLLLEQRNTVVARFVAEIRRDDLSPGGLSGTLLADHIPTFLDEIVAELAGETSIRSTRDRTDTSDTARRHGQQRWKLGYELEALVREYGVLRHCILMVAKEHEVPMSIDDFDVLAKCLSVGVAEAASAYVAHRDEQQSIQNAHLEFLSEAGQLLSSSLDYRSTLTRLTELVVPRMADWCAVHLEDSEGFDKAVAHVDPRKAEVLREIYRRFSPSKDAAHGYPSALRSGESVLVEEAAPGMIEAIALDRAHLDLMLGINTRSWIIVPLRVQGTSFGALTLGYSESGRRYSPQDLVLAEDLARRGAVAIDNAHLYDRSQKERSRVEAATRAKDEFVAMVSHELRTPLNAILGWLRLMRGGSLPESKREHAFDVIERNAQAQSQLVGDLLDISRIITGKIRIHPSQVDLGNVVDMAIEGVRPAAEAKRIELVVGLSRESSVLRGDGDRLQQVVWNLLANAVKFTPKNGSVKITLGRVDSDLELAVEDNGEGIDQTFLPHVFDSFRQSEGGAARAHGGLGIGLSIAKHIVELHGGTITADSAGPGRGARFMVRLPISPLVSTTVGVARVPAAKEATQEVSVPGGVEGLSVLVVDDEPDARELVAYLLEACGIGVRTASSAAQALAELGAYTPDVILSDIGMPGEDGYSLIRAIRTLPSDEKKNIPAIALTAFARNEDRTRALVEGFNMHMTKPVEPAALVKAVLELAGHSSIDSTRRPLGGSV